MTAALDIPQAHAQVRAALAKLDVDQAEAVRWIREGEGHGAVVAVAGSGKTTTVCTGIAALVVLDGVRAQDILALTFTNDAGQEMRSRLIRLLGLSKLPEGMFVGTFHAWAFEQLRAAKIGAWPMDRCVDKSDGSIVPRAERLWESIVCWRKGGVMGLGNPSLSVASIEQVRDYMLAVDRLRGLGLRPGTPEAQKACALLDLNGLHKAWGLYADAKLALNAFDFGDVLDAHLAALTSGALVCTARYVFVDENQDSNTQQHRIALAAAGDNRLVRVGDGRQSIYAFRGADPAAFVDQPGRVIPLRHNYRSQPGIVALGNRVAADMDSRWRPGGDAICGRKTTSTALTVPGVETAEHASTYLLDAETPLDEARAIADAFRAFADADRRLRLSDMAILVRTNSEAGVMEAALNDYGLPCVRLGGEPFWERRDVLAFLAYSVLSAFPTVQDGPIRVAFERLLNRPKRWLPLSFVDEVMEHQGATWPDAVRKASSTASLSAKQKSAATELATFLGKLAAYSWELAIGRIRSLLESDLPPTSKVGEPDEDRNAIPATVAALATMRLARGLDRSGIDFVRYASEAAANSMRESDANKNADKNRVILATTHRSKGLEYAVVAVSMNGFPHPKCNDIEEERRLLYVAVTRARDRLLITRSRKTPGAFDAVVGLRPR